MSKRNKKYCSRGAASKAVVGLQISWADTSPLMDSTGFIEGVISHKNPTHRIYAPTLFSGAKNWIVSGRPFFWRVRMAVVFDAGTDDEYRDDNELTAFIVLDDINEVCEALLIDAMKENSDKNFSFTEFIVDCVSINEPANKAAQVNQ